MYSRRINTKKERTSPYYMTKKLYDSEITKNKVARGLFIVFSLFGGFVLLYAVGVFFYIAWTAPTNPISSYIVVEIFLFAMAGVYFRQAVKLIRDKNGNKYGLILYIMLMAAGMYGFFSIINDIIHAF